MWSCNIKTQWHCHMCFLFIQDCHNLLHARNLNDSCPRRNITYEIKMRSMNNMWERKHHLHGWTGALATNEIRVEYSILHPLRFLPRENWHLLDRRNFLCGLADKKKFTVAKRARRRADDLDANESVEKEIKCRSFWSFKGF